MNIIQTLKGKEKLTVKTAGILAVGVFTFFLLSAWSIGYTSRSEFCNTCHEMNKEYCTWQASAHKNVSCVSCHSEPGAMGVVKEKAKGMREVYVHITGVPETIKADERDINCYSCHQDKVKTDLDKALAMKDPHTQKHFSNGMTCISCHSGLVHNVKLNNTVPSRETCSNCHLDQMNK